MFHIFADYAPVMRGLGWAVLPATGKSPRRAGFNSWRNAPSVEAVRQWAQRDPDANIVYVPGLCETGRNNRGIIVVDSDDADAIGQAEEIFGPTDGKVKTRRGKHFLYNGAGIDLGKLTSLRHLKLNIDLKHGKSGAGIVVAPPSTHEKDHTFNYTWEGCDETVLGHLPPFPTNRLDALLSKHSAKPESLPVKEGKEFRSGSRGLWINDQLTRHGPFFDGEGEELLNSVLEKAAQLNEELPRLGYEMLDDREILTRAKQIVKDIESGKIERRLGLRATCVSDADEVRFLAALAPNGDSAFALLQLFRAEHGARCKRGETFKIAIKSMVECRVMGRWSTRKYREARDLLLQAGSIIEVVPAKARQAAEYMLAERKPTPSLATTLLHRGAKCSPMLLFCRPPRRPDAETLPESLTKQWKESTMKRPNTETTEHRDRRIAGLRPFKKGQSGNPTGRPKGSRHKLAEAFLRDLCAAWESSGIEAIERVASDDPACFLRVIASLIPKQMAAKDDGPLKVVFIPGDERL
jgi:hypothetical protein